MKKQFTKFTLICMFYAALQDKGAHYYILSNVYMQHTRHVETVTKLMRK